jgi:hypothetical protein
MFKVVEIVHPELLTDTSDFHRLKGKEANAIERQVRGAVRGWEKRAKAFGLHNDETDLMRNVIDAER